MLEHRFGTLCFGLFWNLYKHNVIHIVVLLIVGPFFIFVFDLVELVSYHFWNLYTQSTDSINVLELFSDCLELLPLDLFLVLIILFGTFLELVLWGGGQAENSLPESLACVSLGRGSMVGGGQKTSNFF